MATLGACGSRQRAAAVTALPCARRVALVVAFVHCADRRHLPRLRCFPTENVPQHDPFNVCAAEVSNLLVKYKSYRCSNP